MSGRGKRGQSNIIGAILIFSLIVTLLATYQVFLVPQLNSQVEFNHNQEVQADMGGVRGEIIGVAANNEPSSSEVRLGTHYPTRAVAINPPAPTGTFRTVTIGDGNISASPAFDLSTICGTQNVTTTSLTYKPSYNVFQNALPITIENSVMYRERSPSQAALFDSRQILIRGNQITLIPMVGDYQRTSSGTVSVDLIPSETGSGVISTPSAEPSLTIPSKLSESEWERLLEPELASNGGFVNEVNETGDKITFEFVSPNGTAGAPDRYRFRCTHVGINQEPNVNPTTDSELNPNDGDDAIFNPVGSGTITFQKAEIVADTTECGNNNEDCRVDITFKNKRSNIVRVKNVRFIYYNVDGRQPGNSINPPDIATYSGQTFEIRGPAENVNGDLISVGDTEEVSVFFKQSTGNGFDVDEGDLVLVKITFQEPDGSTFTGTYFVPPEE